MKKRMADYTHIGGALDQRIQQTVRDVPDFPKPGIMFKDITPILATPDVLGTITSTLADRYQNLAIDAVVGVESRGFIFGATVAQSLGVPLQLVRKAGKLPAETIEVSYDLEYGSATVEMHHDAITSGQRVVVIDDLLATGGTAKASCQLVEQLGGEVVECTFIIELAFLTGRTALSDYNVCTITKYT